MNILFVFSDTGTSKKQNVFKKSFMQSSTNCNAHLTESIFQTHSSKVAFYIQCGKI